MEVGQRALGVPLAGVGGGAVIPDEGIVRVDLGGDREDERRLVVLLALAVHLREVEAGLHLVGVEQPPGGEPLVGVLAVLRPVAQLADLERHHHLGHRRRLAGPTVARMAGAPASASLSFLKLGPPAPSRRAGRRDWRRSPPPSRRLAGVPQPGEVRGGAGVEAVRLEEVPRGLGVAGEREGLGPQRVDHRGVLGAGARLHRLDLQPAEGAGGERLRRPLVDAVEDLDAVGDAGRRERRLEVAHLVVVEVLVADRAEEEERLPLPRRRAEGEAGAGADDAGERAGDGRARGDGGADGAREAGGVDPLVVDPQTGVAVAPHRPHRRHVGIDRGVARRVVGAGDQVAVLLGAGAEALGGERRRARAGRARRGPARRGRRV